MEVADITKSGFQRGPLKLQKIQGKLKLYFMYTYNITIHVCLKHIRNIKMYGMLKFEACCIDGAIARSVRYLYIYFYFFTTFSEAGTQR